MSAGVELDHVTVRFGDFTAVDNATLDIKGGEFFSFLGPSGCGKTTIAREGGRGLPVSFQTEAMCGLSAAWGMLAKAGGHGRPIGDQE